MIVCKKDGTFTNCLPDGAICRRAGCRPTMMDMCPIYNFDDYGCLCVPELCSEYEVKESNEEENK